MAGDINTACFDLHFSCDVLQLPQSVEEYGSPVWYIVLCLLFAWVIVFTCLIYGPSSIGKVGKIVASLYSTLSTVYLGVSVYMCYIWI